MPGAATSVGGGAATLGYSEQTRLTPLTVGFHETRFLDILNTENGELLQFGPPVLWDSRVRQEHTVPMGPANPQALNRYAYCLGNPLRYVDPTGHGWIQIGEITLTLEQLRELKISLSNWASGLTGAGIVIGAVGTVIGAAASIPEPGSPFLLGLGTGIAVGGAWIALEGIQVADLRDYVSDVIDVAEKRGLAEADTVTLRLSRVEGEGSWYNRALVLSSDLTPMVGNYMWGATALMARYLFTGRIW